MLEDSPRRFHLSFPQYVKDKVDALVPLKVLEVMASAEGMKMLTSATGQVVATAINGAMEPVMVKMREMQDMIAAMDKAAKAAAEVQAHAAYTQDADKDEAAYAEEVRRTNQARKLQDDALKGVASTKKNTSGAPSGSAPSQKKKVATKRTGSAAEKTAAPPQEKTAATKKKPAAKKATTTTKKRAASTTPAASTKNPKVLTEK